MKAAAACFCFVAASVTCAVLLAFPCGGLSSGVAWVTFIIGFLVALFAWRCARPLTERRLISWDVLLLVVFGVASLRAFLWLIYQVDDEWRIISPNNLGDISLHLQFIRYFANGVNFWPASPILADTSLTYPLGADLFNSLLALVGVPVERGLIWVALGGASLSAWALWRWGGAFAIAAFLFNGGLAGFAIFHTGALADFQSDLAWKNFFLSMFVTQRGLLYALPCGLFLLSVWRDDFFGRGSGVPRILQLLLYATMPLFNVHAFAFLSVVLLAIFLLEAKTRWCLIRFIAYAFAPATVLMFLVTGGFSVASCVRWLPGWMQGGEGGMFWLTNFGISLPLLGALGWVCLRKPDHELLSFAGTSLVIFILCCFVAVAPWEWDNTKLFIWSWIICAPYLWSRVIFPLPCLARMAVCFLLFFSGAVSLVGGLDGRHGYSLVRHSELAAAEVALHGVPATARIAVEPRYNHPVILLGYPVFCGYEGHLWSHGLDYQRHWEKLQTVLAGGPGWYEKAQTLDADWLYLDGTPPTVIPLKSE